MPPDTGLERRAIKERRNPLEATGIDIVHVEPNRHYHRQVLALRRQGGRASRSTSLESRRSVIC